MPEWEEVQGVSMKRHVMTLAILLIGSMAAADAQTIMKSGRGSLRGAGSDHASWQHEIVWELSGVWILRAEEVDFANEGTRVVASGNVVFISDGGCVTADRAEFEVARETGNFLGAGTFHNARVSGSESCGDR